MNEYYEFRSKRIKELDETFEITHFYGDDYPENINVEVNKIINNEWKLNNLQSKIDKAIEYINTWLVDEYSISVPDKKEPDVFCHYEPDAKDKLLDILKGE